MKKLIYGFALLLMGVILTQCEQPDCGCTTYPPVFFQYEYTNHAWGFRHHGFLIDENGHVNGFSQPESWKEPDSLGMISKSDLEFNMAQCDTVCGEVSVSELRMHFQKVEDIRSGKLIDHGMVMADAGTGILSAWYWNEKNRKYENVLLITNGDVFIENSHPDVSGLVDWLKNIGENTNRFYWYGGAD